MSKLSGKVKAKLRKQEQKEKTVKFEKRKKDILSKLKDTSKLFNLCDHVEQKDSEEVKNIISEMRRVLYYSNNGVGLSANQIGYLKSIVLVKPSANLPPYVMINPEVLEKSKEETVEREGCLSFPGKYVPISRPNKIKVKYLNEDFKEIEKTAEGFEARIICHEVDHTLGECKVSEFADFLAKQFLSSIDEEFQEISDKINKNDLNRTDTQVVEMVAPDKYQFVNGNDLR